ncbi:zinc finger and SCAN domain-containing protein 5B [Sturnira hondurensis]|uniref:zinc finger and SCAN domain-containing protein 5B n=1 Tax=Sturnira hondurensis TaxID=192404 RepID=UPI00187A7B5F|nr:zinc finger and SCAN domain-containing protein 5B [Sturnira hondurensis]
MWHVAFRAFTSSEDSDPVQDLGKLSELCRLWLRPDLHTAEQILDKLVLEQFMISMPLELQVLVKDRNVQSCKDLEGILRRKEKPKTCTIVSMGGQEFLEQNSHGVEVGDERPVMDLSTKPHSFVCEVEVHAENSQEPETRPQIQGMSRGQGQAAPPPETIPEEGDPEGVRPTQTLEKDPMADQEAMTVLTSPEPQLPTGPEFSVGTKSEEDPLEGPSTENVGALANPTHDSETEVLPRRGKRKNSQGAKGPLGSKRPHTSTPQDGREEGAMGLDGGEFSRQLRSRSAHAKRTVRKDARQPKLRECADCQKTFSYPSQLDLHRRKHTGERPFQCHLCQRKFTQPSDLRVHLRVHTGERPHVCHVCGKSFAHESTRRGHWKVHTREKPYPCPVCQRPFSHKGNLNVHLRTHTGLRPYACPECGQTFRQAGTLRRHQKTHANRASQGPQLPSA